MCRGPTTAPHDLPYCWLPCACVSRLALPSLLVGAPLSVAVFRRSVQVRRNHGPARGCIKNDTLMNKLGIWCSQRCVRKTNVPGMGERRVGTREEARASSTGQQDKMRSEKGNRAVQNGLQPETAKLFFPSRGGGGGVGSVGAEQHSSVCGCSWWLSFRSVGLYAADLQVTRLPPVQPTQGDPRLQSTSANASFQTNRGHKKGVMSMQCPRCQGLRLTD